MRRRAHRSAAVSRSLWAARIWPLFAGAVTAVGLSSPAALRLLARVRPRTRRRGVDEVVRPAVGVLVDKALLDRRFEDIVNQLTESGDFPQN